MTQDEIIELARQAGINYRELSGEFATGNGDGVEIEQMQAFAKLVAAEAIADYEKQEPQGVQVSPKQFVESTFGNRHIVGRPVIWAEWPSREKNT